jgi:hypothetical protein
LNDHVDALRGIPLQSTIMGSLVSANAESLDQLTKRIARSPTQPNRAFG